MRPFDCTVFGLLVCTSAHAGVDPVTFNFNDLDRFDRGPQISEYMTGIYGSEISVAGAVTSNDRSDIGVGDTNFFMATSFQILERGDFEILFGDVPIIAARFEGHVIDATPGDDFKFFAYAGDELVLEFHRNDGMEIFDSGLLSFDQPVDRIRISDSGRKDVGLDDFTVHPVPEPATLLLMGAAGAAMMLRRRTASA